MTIVELVASERARLRRMHLIAGLGLTLGATSVLLALGTLMLGGARWIALPRGVPLFVWLIVAAVDVAAIVWTARRLERRTAPRHVAATIEREQAMRAGALRGALEVADSGALGRRAADTLAARLAPAATRLAPREQRSARRGAVQATGAATVALAALAFAAPRYSDGFHALVQPMAAWHGTLLGPLHFDALPAAVLRGETLRLRIAAPRRSSVTLTQRTPGEAWTAETVSVDPRTGIAIAETAPLRGDLTVVASDGRTSTDTAVVRVTDRPFVGAVSMRATYPAYLTRPAEGLPIGEPARVPQGTVIDITGRASTPLRNVHLLATKDTLALRVDDRAFAGRLVARTSGTWSWSATGIGGPITDLPLPIELEVVPDSAPRVDLVAPAVDTLVAGNDRIALNATASDDHGLAHIDLVSWRQPAVGPADAPLTQRLADDATTSWDGTPTLDLAPRGLHPGDALHVKFVATDNSPWGQFGQSRELLLKIPTMEERRAMAREAADSAVHEATSAAQAEKSIEERTSDAARDRSLKSAAEDSPSSASSAGGQQHTMSYEQAEKAKAVAKDQRALADRVRALQQSAASLQQQLKQAGALDSSLARQLQEAQALLRDAMTPELLAQMKKLDDATQQLSAEQAEAALKDMQAMQERLREQLEKSAEMLKRAGIEGSMQTLKDEAKDIAGKERQLADSAASQSAHSDAQHLADRSQRFSDEVKKLQDRLEKANADAGKAGADEARKRADASQEAMRDAAGQPQNAEQRSQSQAAHAQSQPGQRQGAQAQSSQSQNPNGQSKTSQQQNSSGQQKAGQQQSQNGQPQPGQSPNQNGPPQGSQSDRNAAQQQNGSFSQQANDAASQMQRAADAMQQARDAQVGAWKSELTNTLDKSIQEMLEMGRQEQSLAQQARSGQAKPDAMRGAQSAVKQGLDDAAKRLEQEGQKTSLLSGRSERAVADAQQKVSDATKASSDARGSQQAASAMDDAADALNRAAASLARDREKANSASSATGFADMLQQMQEMAKKQGSINAQAQGLLPGMGQSMSSQMQATARALAREQRQVAQQLDDLSESAGGDRAAEMAKEAKQLAEALEGGRLDATTLARQQQLFRRMLDAGRSLQKDERDDTGKRQATAAKGGNEYAPTNTDASGRAASKFQAPTWDELRGLSADERRAILEYFKRINGP